MLIHVIKRCASISKIARIKVYFQCSEPSALHFNIIIGFRQINKGERNNGYGLLPKHMRNDMEAQSESAFLWFPLSESLGAENQAMTPILMHLRPGVWSMSPQQKQIPRRQNKKQAREKHWRRGQRLTGANILLPNWKAVGNWSKIKKMRTVCLHHFLCCTNCCHYRWAVIASWLSQT